MTVTEPSIDDLASLTSGASAWETTSLPGELDPMVLSDGPHGLRRQPAEGDTLGIGNSIPATCFPPAVGLASSWNDDLIEQVGAQLAREAKALGVSVLLGPGLNIKRSPLCGRNFEYASEDPQVAGRYGAAFVRGIQSQGVAATPKHFAVNNQETDRFRVSAQVDERTLREIYLSAFEHVVTTAGPWALMSSYNQVNGVPASENPHLLREILREEWGFDGVVMSDWGAVSDRVAALAAGLDLEMPPSSTDDQIAAATGSGIISRERLEQVHQRLHLLAERTAGVRSHTPSMTVDVEAGDRVAQQAARESAVLLTNNGVLPLAAPALDNIAVIGEFARTPRYQGSGSSQVVPTRLSTVLETLRESAGDRVSFAPGFTLDGSGDKDQLGQEAVDLARNASVALVFVGLPAGSESEGFDRTHIDLPEEQTQLLDRLVKLDTPTVVVVSCGSVVSLGSWSDQADAVVMGWLLGQAGGKATVDLLTGAASPSGRLTETIPLSLTDTPAYLNFPGQDGVVVYGEGLHVGYRYYDTMDRPVRFPFGHGLTYTTFEYGAASVTATGTNSATVEFSVTNTGARPGSEVAQVYVAANDRTRPRHELRGYQKVFLDPGESITCRVELDSRAFSEWNAQHAMWVVPGREWTLEVGASSRDIRSTASFTTKAQPEALPLQDLSTVGEWLAHPVGSTLIAPLIAAIGDKVDVTSLDPTLYKMFEQMPLVKLTAWGQGFTREMYDGMLSQANAQQAPGA
ncbi:glycoside hydrolase family 3 C-terminal domain-containing protein [Branchiibius cervicis]|uniref:Glycoside hydrolase family 3 C-terminal domain-containing protein n=1 Tax=Branchiibius cervicis TaxID=908252 RepID=A0ABW2AY51_9MICO